MSKISKEIFEQETEMCKKLSQENNGKCNWGECEKCGVIPLLYKLYKNKLLEDKTEIKKVKNKIISTL